MERKQHHLDIWKKIYSHTCKVGVHSQARFVATVEHLHLKPVLSSQSVATASKVFTCSINEIFLDKCNIVVNLLSV